MENIPYTFVTTCDNEKRKAISVRKRKDNGTFSPHSCPVCLAHVSQLADSLGAVCYVKDEPCGFQSCLGKQRKLEAIYVCFDCGEKIGKRIQASRYRAAKDDALRSLGLTKVRGPVTGKVYWE